METLTYNYIEENDLKWYKKYNLACIYCIGFAYDYKY